MSYQSKSLSCGVILINEQNEILMIHATGQSFWDIPKGTKSLEETECEAAIRELKEETGIELCPSDLIDMSWYQYNGYKDLWLFIAKMPDVDMNKLSCSSYFEKDGYQHPEADQFQMIALEDAPFKACKSMSRLLNQSLMSDINLFSNRL